jgi:predicted O-linked N-acetylglucosamine transferase (SPINDLY family)
MRKYYPGSSQRLGAEAAARGIDPARLRFANGVSREEHLARLATADLYLDTFPYGAGSTAADALWAGVPLLTCTGESYVSRMAASQLVAMGVGELAATNLTDYRAQAIGLAKDPARLKSLRDRIAMNKHRSSLFDSRRFTAQLERVYAEMSRQFREGVWPRRPILDVT